MKKFLLFFVMLSVTLQYAVAQNTQVSGIVTYADDGSPVTGATIVVKGTMIATISDAGGAYKIDIPGSIENKVLEVSYLGLRTQERSVHNAGVINFEMATDVFAIDNIVVTAYGTTNRKAFTGTASVVKAFELKNQQVTSADAALQGLASGVIVVGTNGQPGEKSTIRVRGVGSITGESDPLIVLDGIAYNGDLNTINIADIESMTVLKDASSTALYGSRAANGVIMITTKSGRPGKARVSATASYGISNRAVKNYEFVGAGEYMEMQWEALYNTYKPGYGDAAARQYATEDVTAYTGYNPYGNDPRFQNPVGTDGKTVEGAKLLYDTDWYDALTRLGRRQQYDVQISGGSEATTYMISLGALNDKGIIAASSFERYNGRVKVDSKIRDWITIGLNSGVSYSHQNYALQGDTYTSNTIGFINGIANIYPLYELDATGKQVLDNDGNAIPDYGRGQHPGSVLGARPIFAGANPYGTATLNQIGHDRFMSSNNVYLEAAVLKDFKFKTNLGIEYYNYNSNEFNNPLYGDGAAYKGSSEKNRRQYTTLTWVNTLTYDKTIKDRHHINVLAGVDSHDYREELVMAQRQGFDFPGQNELIYGTSLTGANSTHMDSRNVRYLARTNYDFDSRYHLSASYTYDGTSRFTKSNRWGSFYSVGAAWNISNENFFENNVGDWFNNLKLRASYGTSGNQNIGYFPYMGAYITGENILNNGGSVVYRLANNDLTWEKQTQLDAGLDFGFLRNRLNFGVTYYNRTSRDLLLARPLPISGGMPSINENIGKVRNSGVEFEISAIPVNTSTVRWDVGFNISYLKNRVMALPQANLRGGMSQPNYKQLFVGESAYTWYIPEFAGINPDNGAATWWMDADPNDPSKGRVVTEDSGSATKYKMGNALPKWTGGFNTNLTLHGFDVGIIGAFSIGGKILDMDKASLMHMMSVTGGQLSADARNAWKKPGDVTDVAAMTVGYSDFNGVSSRWLVDASYFRLRNLTIGYNFANFQGVKNAGFNTLRLYVSAQNLFTIFGPKGLDPEQRLAGLTDYASSALRTFSIGISIGL